HLSDDLPECGEIGTEDAVAVHAPQFPGDATRLPQYFHEERAAAQIVTEAVVDQMAMRPDETDGFRSDPAQLRMLLQQQEDLEQGKRITGEDIGRCRFYETVADMEAPVDRLDR